MLAYFHAQKIVAKTQQCTPKSIHDQSSYIKVFHTFSHVFLLKKSSELVKSEGKGRFRIFQALFFVVFSLFIPDILYPLLGLTAYSLSIEIDQNHVKDGYAWFSFELVFGDKNSLLWEKEALNV